MARRACGSPPRRSSRRRAAARSRAWASASNTIRTTVRPCSRRPSPSPPRAASLVPGAALRLGLGQWSVRDGVRPVAPRSARRSASFGVPRYDDTDRFSHSNRAPWSPGSTTRGSSRNGWSPRTIRPGGPRLPATGRRRLRPHRILAEPDRRRLALDRPDQHQRDPCLRSVEPRRGSTIRAPPGGSPNGCWRKPSTPSAARPATPIRRRWPRQTGADLQPLPGRDRVRQLWRGPGRALQRPRRARLRRTCRRDAAARTHRPARPAPRSVLVLRDGLRGPHRLAMPPRAGLHHPPGAVRRRPRR